jgi:hypothetical protein
VAARLNPYEKQALASAALAGLALLSTLALAVFIFSVYSPEMGVPYKQGGLRFYAIVGAAGLACAAGGIGFMVGLNSAGQKTNKRSQLSWLGFFASAGVLTVALCLFMFFWMLKDPVSE